MRAGLHCVCRRVHRSIEMSHLLMAAIFFVTVYESLYCGAILFWTTCQITHAQNNKSFRI